MRILQILILVATTSFISCTKNKQDITEPVENSIIGSWRLIEEVYGSLVEQGNWETIENGNIIRFSENMSYTSDAFPTCSSNPQNDGTYLLNTNNDISFVTITLECSEANNGIIELTYQFSFEDDFLILSPTFGCDEGCAFKYNRIINP